MIIDAIKNFNQQFAYEPAIENDAHFRPAGKFIAAGMGGSALAGALIKMWHPTADIIIHRDYGLPALAEQDLRQRLLIASSYSGATEETIDAFNSALAIGLPVIAISTGGKLIPLAKEKAAPFIQFPPFSQPRTAMGFSVKAHFKAMAMAEALASISELTTALRPADFEPAGAALAKKLAGKVPVIYTSTANQAIGYTWKIIFNETAKIPAFFNVLPELNHNEMTGFDVKDATRPLSSAMAFIFLCDPADHPRVQRRFEVLADLYKARGLAVHTLELNSGSGPYFKTFASLLTASWAALHLAQRYGNEPEQVPMVEEFKKLI